MKNVDFYSVQVKYTGNFEDYTKDEMFDKALAKMGSGVDCYDKTVELSDPEADKMDGMVDVDNTYPCNKIATVRWAYIAEYLDEEQ